MVEDEAATVRMIFERFIRIGSATLLVKELAEEGITRRGKKLDKGGLYKLLANPLYIGKAVHKGVAHDGEHEAIIDQALWDKVRAVMEVSPRTRASRTRAQTPALLKGLIFAPGGRAMTPAHTRKGGKLYRYYVTMNVIKEGPDACPVGRVPAAQVENAVIDQLRSLLRTPEVVARTWKSIRAKGKDMTEREVATTLGQLDPLWDELFPAEQARIVQLLVERVDLSPQGINISLRTDGLAQLAGELKPAKGRRAAA
ncbi:putative resolvase [Magnetospirillum gryphiswaldense MSR-1 v2]|uniref:Resolvase n=1 Tax=Magnetospirillum gryphiswaldense (strain DSM 6361 / JCM 21280 / NBRC 15271 / MSR-1) TaxID=431944 RepID=V6F796_MAGGM|nr:recombinase family protein [Magnetospirillum gryphiswaldense]CDL01242.1 putative resolvase [Magnetospirillum gryphiswaldense MSR-1 v2]